MTESQPTDTPSKNVITAAGSGGSKKALFFILATVMINSIGFGIMIPVLPDLLVELTNLPLNEAAIHGGWLTFVFAVMQFIFMPIIGGLSDAYGRRPIMLFSLAGLSFDYFLMAFAPTIAFLYLGRIIAGALGATFSTANAYIADISPPETRAQNFGLVGAAFGIGFMFGPVLGGFFGEFGPRVPFFAAGVISLLNVIFGYFVLPETLARDDRRQFSWKRSNPIGSVLALGRVKGVKGLIFVLFVLALAHTTYPSSYAFSTMEKLNWDSGQVGLSLGAFGLASIVAQGWLIRLAIPKIGLFWAGLIGMLSAVIAYTGMGLATQGWVIYAMGPFAALAGFYGPALSNMMSMRVSKSEQGELQGAIGAAQGLALMIGPLAMTRSFEYFAAKSDTPRAGLFENSLPEPLAEFSRTLANIYEPGAPFLLAALLAAIGFVTFILITDDKDKKARPSDALEEDEITAEVTDAIG